MKRRKKYTVAKGISIMERNQDMKPAFPMEPVKVMTTMTAIVTTTRTKMTI